MNNGGGGISVTVVIFGRDEAEIIDSQNHSNDFEIIFKKS